MKNGRPRSLHEIRKLADERKEIDIRREERAEMERRVQARLKWHRFMRMVDPLYEMREKLFNDPARELWDRWERERFPDARQARWKILYPVAELVRGYRRYHTVLKRMKRAGRWNRWTRGKTIHGENVPRVYVGGTGNTPRELALVLLARRYDLPLEELRKHLRGKLGKPS